MPNEGACMLIVGTVTQLHVHAGLHTVHLVYGVQQHGRCIERHVKEGRARLTIARCPIYMRQRWRCLDAVPKAGQFEERICDAHLSLLQVGRLPWRQHVLLGARSRNFVLDLLVLCLSARLQCILLAINDMVIFVWQQEKPVNLH